MERKKWFSFVVSALSLVFGLVLEVYFPQVKDAVCIALPGIRPSNFDGLGHSDRIEPTDNNIERIK